MTEWAERRHLHEVAGVAKKELARRFGRDVKTIRRALDRTEPPLVRRTPRRGRLLDPHEQQVRAWLKDEPKITSRRIAVLVRGKGVVIRDRAVAKYVKWLREQMRGVGESFVHRSERAGRTLEIDFMETESRTRDAIAWRDEGPPHESPRHPIGARAKPLSPAAKPSIRAKRGCRRSRHKHNNEAARGVPRACEPHAP